MRAKAIMVQGTASSVGKSVLVTALCRIFRQDGWEVAPFKAQNMSLNSFATPDGGEIGRAQAVQAEAAGVEPTVDMNPILLKPEADNRSQVVIRGKPAQTLNARNYFCLHDQLWTVIEGSLNHLLEHHEVVVIEGAGSPAEINLKDKDLVNMKVACRWETPVLLVGDIDCGGVFASLVGTLALLEPAERQLIKAFVINKFRGDVSLLSSGLSWLEERTGIRVAGIIPYYRNIRIAEEDSVSLQRRRAMKEKTGQILDIAVIALPHISNFNDFDPLEQEAGIRLRYVEEGDRLESPDLIILPGTKSTVSDLTYLEKIGLRVEIVNQFHRGTPVIGICGGFQMLGRTILDPEHLENQTSHTRGLGLLPVISRFHRHKSVSQVRCRVTRDRGLLKNASHLEFTGYEIHMGQTIVSEKMAPFQIQKRSGEACCLPDGCLSEDGNVLGTYIHGLFHNDPLRRAILEELASRKGATLPASTCVASKEDPYDKLAKLVRGSLDMQFIYELVGLR